MERSRLSLREARFAGTVMRDRLVRERLGTIMATSHADANNDHTTRKTPSRSGDNRGGQIRCVARDPIKLRSLMPHPPLELSLAFGLRFEDLYAREGLERVDRAFIDALRARDDGLAERLLAARAAPESMAYKDEADLLLEAAPDLDRFIARLFGIEAQWEDLVDGHHRLAPLFRVKRKFVQRRAMLKIKADEAATLDGAALEHEVARRLGGAFDELAFANAVLEWQADEPSHAEDLVAAERLAAWAAHTPEGRRRFADGVLFRPPQRVDPMHLVPVDTKDGEIGRASCRERV